MKILHRLVLIIAFAVIFSSCNTLYNTKIINIEIIEPGRVKIPNDYQSIAVRYNNCNVSFNPNFSEYSVNREIKTDKENTDSIASEIYFNHFVENISKQGFFDSVYIIKPQNYSNIQLIDSLIKPLDNDVLLYKDEIPSKISVSHLNSTLKKYIVDNKNKTQKKTIDPNYGLYTKNEIQDLADSTSADLLISLDFFATLDGTSVNRRTHRAAESVFVITYWNFYDLHEQKLKYFYDRIDTITWNTDYYNEERLNLPPRKDAIFNAADISGNRFAEFLIPHWIEVERIYYQSGHVDLKLTDKLIKENKWKEAAKIWKANVNNPNKNIAAKCMFNLGVACEMEGQIEAAIDWVVKSYHIFGQKNEIHYYNCMDYIRILGQRKLDIRKIDQQLDFQDF